MSESIEELRQRWEQDPSPQLSLQLAEEYRRLEQPAKAAGVLTRALEEHPGHVAARVALGRYRFELGEVEEACTLLERVVIEDPTQLVASKLLVSLYLERGDERQARDRLDLYKLLNESDPEIELLEARLRGDSEMSEATVSGIVDVPRNGDPFQDLWSDFDGAAYLQALGAEGIFPVSGQARSATTVRIEAPAAVEEEIPATTVTLANLYLQQGHLDDAEKAFGEILDGEPANQEALAGLDEVEKQRRESLGTQVVAEVAATPEAGDAASRKIEILKDYLQRIRTAGNR